MYGPPSRKSPTRLQSHKDFTSQWNRRKSRKTSQGEIKAESAQNITGIPAVTTSLFGFVLYLLYIYRLYINLCEEAECTEREFELELKTLFYEDCSYWWRERENNNDNTLLH